METASASRAAVALDALRPAGHQTEEPPKAAHHLAPHGRLQLQSLKIGGASLGVAPPLPGTSCLAVESSSAR